MEETAYHNNPLTFALIMREELNELDTDRMFCLMDESYDHIDKTTFLSDLANKHYVGILRDQQSTIQGFTTFAINPKGTGTSAYSIIFSGDTVISPKYWGSQEMMRGWGISVGKIIATDTEKRWYWFLLSKGHRTYMYLPLFFNHYYPSIAEPINTELEQIIDQTAQKLYPGKYDAKKGIIKFDVQLGQLKPELAQTTFEKQDKPHVKLFLEKNPGFYKGDELVCLALLHPTNTRGYGKKYMIEGMEQKLPQPHDGQ